MEYADIPKKTAGARAISPMSFVHMRAPRLLRKNVRPRRTFESGVNCGLSAHISPSLKAAAVHTGAVTTHRRSVSTSVKAS